MDLDPTYNWYTKPFKPEDFYKSLRKTGPTRNNVLSRELFSETSEVTMNFGPKQWEKSVTPLHNEHKSEKKTDIIRAIHREWRNFFDHSDYHNDHRPRESLPAGCFKITSAETKPKLTPKQQTENSRTGSSKKTNPTITKIKKITPQEEYINESLECIGDDQLKKKILKKRKQYRIYKTPNGDKENNENIKIDYNDNKIAYTIEDALLPDKQNIQKLVLRKPDLAPRIAEILRRTWESRPDIHCEQILTSYEFALDFLRQSSETMNYRLEQ